MKAEIMPINEVVVGVEDSPAGERALLWAARHARLTHRELRAVHVFSPRPGAPMMWSPQQSAMVSASVDDRTHDLEKRRLHEMFNALTPRCNWKLQFEEGSAGAVLVAESAGARLLVIGNSESPGGPRPIAGSVGHYCLSHARCPVVAVPPPEPSDPFSPLRSQEALLEPVVDAQPVG